MSTPLKAHWGLSDPAEVDGNETTDNAAFEQTWHWRDMRPPALLDLPFETMDRQDLTAKLSQIGMMEGAA